MFFSLSVVSFLKDLVFNLCFFFFFKKKKFFFRCFVFCFLFRVVLDFLFLFTSLFSIFLYSSLTLCFAI